MTYLVEKIDPRSERPDLTDETFRFTTAEAAGRRFDSEASPQNFPREQIVSALFYEGEVRHTDPETGVEVIARRA